MLPVVQISYLASSRVCKKQALCYVQNIIVAWMLTPRQRVLNLYYVCMYV